MFDNHAVYKVVLGLALGTRNEHAVYRDSHHFAFTFVRTNEIHDHDGRFAFPSACGQLQFRYSRLKCPSHCLAFPMSLSVSVVRLAIGGLMQADGALRSRYEGQHRAAQVLVCVRLHRECFQPRLP
jgi:hypothetical protein